MSDKVKIGIIGAGWWATENHIPVLQRFTEVEVVGVCDVNKRNLERVQQKFNISYATQNHLDLLDSRRVQGVVVCSPHHLHYQHAGAALIRGIHVLCEKPMTLVASEARDLEALVAANRLQFVVAYGWNYTDYAARLKQLVNEGTIGEIQHVHLHMASALRDLFSAEGASFAQEAFLKPGADTWSKPEIGGGFAHGQLTHALGLLFWATDLKPKEVFAFRGNSSTGADLFQAISCRFQNGATGMLGGAGTMPPSSTYQLDLRLFGSEGMLLLDIERPRLELRRDDGCNTTMTMTCAPGAYSCTEPLHVFADLLLGRAVENRSSVKVGARVVELLDAAIRSAKSGKVECV